MLCSYEADEIVLWVGCAHLNFRIQVPVRGEREVCLLWLSTGFTNSYISVQMHVSNLWTHMASSSSLWLYFNRFLPSCSESSKKAAIRALQANSGGSPASALEDGRRSRSCQRPSLQTSSYLNGKSSSESGGVPFHCLFRAMAFRCFLLVRVLGLVQA